MAGGIDLDLEIELLERDIGIIDVRPGDAIIIQIRQRVPPVHLEKIQDTVRRVFPGNKCLILENGASFGVARKAENG